MAKECKTLMRPKVRFSEQSDSTDDSDICVGPFHGPKIKSIIQLDKPVRLIHGVSEQNSPNNHEDNINEPSTNDLPMAKASTHFLPTCASAPCLTEINSGNRISTKSNKLSNNNPKCPPNISTKIISTKSSKQIPAKSSTVPIKNSGTANKRQLNTKNYVECNKENVSQRSAKSKEDNAKDGAKSSSSSLNKPKVADKKKVAPVEKSKSSAASKLKATNSAPIKDLLSRVKLPNTVTKQRAKSPSTHRSKFHVRSEMTKNISGTKPNVYVGPGMPRTRTKSLPSSSEKIYPSTKIISNNKLDRPEYNSIMFTIKKLRDVKREKIVADLDNLPMNYRHSCLKKMSSALDFPPSESIFHDLIDLSITEKQLPLRLLRSKDPEPREKDLQPRLSDFFVPEYGSEYAEAVKIRPRSPQIIDNLSAFKISDRIFCWKTCLNDI